MEPTLYRPPVALTDHVEYFWKLEGGQENRHLTFKTFASGVSGIIFQHHEGRSVLGPTTARKQPVNNEDLPTSIVYGKRTKPSHTFAKGPFVLLGVIFKPQGLSTLLDIQPAELTNAPVALADVSRGNLGDNLLNARTDHERFVLFGHFLCRRIDRARPEDLVVTESLDLIHRNIRSIRVPQLLKRLDVSERQFERRFVRGIGVSPHRYIRIARFQEGVRLLKIQQFARLSDVAHDLNYADQSHFIKAIREFSGYTPTRLSEMIRTSVELPCFYIPSRTKGPSAEDAHS